MRIAVSGSHGVGKSTLIDRFLREHPEYVHEPEAYEVLADDVELTESGAPTRDGLTQLLTYAVATLAARAGQPNVIFERSPVDYLAYAAASVGAWERDEIRDFLRAQRPIVRASIRNLELIAYIPLSKNGPAPRSGEDKAFRHRVDSCLKAALFEDRHELFADDRAPLAVSLPPGPGQLTELNRLERPHPHP